MTDGFSLQDDISHWARGVLGLVDPITANDVQRAFLKRLAEHQLVPDDLTAAAWEILSCNNRIAVAAPLHSAAVHVPCAPPSQEVADFAECFFAYQPLVRRETWKALTARCDQQPALFAWLNQLAPALNVEMPTLTPPGDVGTLLELLSRLVVLPLPRRAIARQLALHDFSAEVRRWAKAAKALRRQYRQIAECEPRLIEYLISRPTRASRRRLMLSRAGRAREIHFAVQWCREHTLGLVVAASMLVGLSLGLIMGASKTSNPSHSKWNANQGVQTQKQLDEQLDEQIAKMRWMVEESEKRRRAGLPPDPKLEVGEAARRLFGLESRVPASSSKESDE